ncbi:NPCBM/NEW2 domain-containing protein [Pseudoduganella sp. SL102]|uniref:NPCBM/NEW2 domain-containing protein n=1 Tax=Pseudoduganella sp. SL102 TaxID=2995154 RepID=UPI00248D0EDC|nr:NPCBM/NEW2 domain-containing protein [Pseudoduganella sp. SL102]WBS01146.1 NPCBM/NEW2 domain-containing protein [Pseudoduganella sp. SL102]
MQDRWSRMSKQRQGTFLRSVVVAAAALLATQAHGSPSADPLAPAGRWEGNMRGSASTPPMGWNSWNAFRTEVDEDKVMGAARVLVDSGLAKLGYTQVNLDDGWWLKRRTGDGRLQIRTGIFPSAATGGPDGTSFKPFTDRLHAMGLKAGIYTDIGRNACSQAYDLHSPNLPQGTTAEREVGLDGHVTQDINLYFREWGFDYIKIDACGLADFVPGSELVKKQDYRAMAPLIERNSINRTDIAAVRARYEAVAAALKAARPANDYVLSICAWGMANVRTWGKDVGNLWRTSSDITPSWTSMLHNFDSAAKRPLYAGPGHWNDPDILHIGHGDFDAAHPVEVRSHFSLWAMINAPMLVSYDLRNGPAAFLAVLGNADVVRLNQDKAGHQGVVTYDSDDAQIIVKTLGDGQRKAVALFNRGASPAPVTLLARHLKLSDSAPVTLRDLWSKQRVTFTGEKAFTLAPRETLVFEATGTRQLENGVYLSEIPGSINVAVDGTRQPQPDPTIHRMIDPWSNTRSGGSRPQYAGWGGAQADTTPFGQTLQVAGQAFDSGIGILANSRLQVKNDAGHAVLTASVGVDDSTEDTKQPVRFHVYGDGKLLAESPPVAFGARAHRLRADIRGVKVIELVVRGAASDGAAPVVATWGDVQLVRAAGR